VIDALSEKLPKVSDHLDSARADLLAFTAFPKQIWRQISLTRVMTLWCGRECDDREW
jgi:transposase-like protein